MTNKKVRYQRNEYPFKVIAVSDVKGSEVQVARISPWSASDREMFGEEFVVRTKNLTLWDEDGQPV